MAIKDFNSGTPTSGSSIPFYDATNGVDRRASLQEFADVLAELMTIEPSSDTAIWVQLTSGVYALQTPDGGQVSLSEVSPVVTISATGIVISGACEYGGYYVRSFSGSPSLTIYDATSATGTPILAATTISATGPFPWMGAGTTHRRANSTGIYAVISGTLTVDILGRAT